MLQYILDIIGTPIKSFFTVFTGSFTGSIPLVVVNITGESIPQPIHFMQWLVWILTALVAIASLITWIQKQVERLRRKASSEN